MTAAAPGPAGTQAPALSGDAAALVQQLMILQRELADLAERDADTQPEGRIWATMADRVNDIINTAGGPVEAPTNDTYSALTVPAEVHKAFVDGWRGAHHDARSRATTYLGHKQPTGLGWGPDDVVVDGDWLAHHEREHDKAKATIARVRAVVPTLPADAQDAVNAVLAPRPPRPAQPSSQP